MVRTESGGFLQKNFLNFRNPIDQKLKFMQQKTGQKTFRGLLNISGAIQVLMLQELQNAKLIG